MNQVLIFILRMMYIYINWCYYTLITRAQCHDDSFRTGPGDLLIGWELSPVLQLLRILTGFYI
jgi:hypothetical protein